MSEKLDTEGIDEILEIMKSGYSQYYERTQNIDNKNGFFIAFHSAVLLFLIDKESINKVFNSQISSVGQVFVYGMYLLLSFAILVLAIVSIGLFIYSLKSRNIKYLPLSLCDEKYYNSEIFSLKKELLKSYKEIGTYNEEIIDKKHEIYNVASILTIIEVVFIGICMIIQIFL